LNASYTFPIGIPSLWCEPEQGIIPNTRLKNWLLDTGSLTEKLQSKCATFHLTLIGQKQANITSEEFQRVCAPGQQLNPQEWQVREVLLWVITNLRYLLARLFQKNYAKVTFLTSIPNL
jgi:chorismate--pyruvate lyase